MKTISIFSLLVILMTTCAATSPSTGSPLESALGAGASAVSADSVVYISATMHIESNPNSWPTNADTFIAFLAQTTQAGYRWSIGADVGWLQNSRNAADIIKRASALGVQWDVHAHKASDRAKVAYLLSKFGVTPTSVVSGFTIPEFDGLLKPLTYRGYTWTPTVVWGGVTCVGHATGCDDTSIAIYRPRSSADFYTHDPNGTLIKIGGGDHSVAGADWLVAQVTSGTYSYPVIGFTIMVAPRTLKVVNSGDDLAALLDFAVRMLAQPNVRFETIAATAQAWAGAGGVPFKIESP